MTSWTSTGARFADPVVARWGTGRPTAPLVVVLHNSGASQNSMIELAPFLPFDPAYAAVRGPIEDGGGFAWFATRGPGRPVPESLAATTVWFLDWLDTEGDPDRPVLLLGFGGGAAFAGGLMLRAPERFAAGVLLYGTLPFDAGVPFTRGRLAGMPVFLAHGRNDTVIPPELQHQTWEYLVKSSGAPLWAQREDGGHQLAGETVGEVARWLGERLAYVHRYGENPVPDGEDQYWPTLPGGRLPERAGEPPEVSVTRSTHPADYASSAGRRPRVPQQQESQNAPAELQEALYTRLCALDGVRTAPSGISVPGARAFLLDPAQARGPDDAFILPDVGEFAHLHPEHDGSLHLVLPAALAYDALAKGWALAHPLAGIRLSRGMVMVFGPRDEAELDVVAGIVAAGHAYATKAE